MTIKLEEFRLESYDERQVILMALAGYWDKVMDMPGLYQALQNLEQRLSDTQCQPGGCSYCGGPIED
jgi:hypothetical protein